MRDSRLVYERRLTDPNSWSEFSIEHIAFGLHRLTGWLLLGWVGVHLAVPSFTRAPTAVWIPTSKVVIVLLLSVFVFHAFNGIRLLVAEWSGAGTGHTRRVFQGTLLTALVCVVVLGWLL